jgi:hypothetical protein
MIMHTRESNLSGVMITLKAKSHSPKKRSQFPRVGNTKGLVAKKMQAAIIATVGRCPGTVSYSSRPTLGKTNIVVGQRDAVRYF